MGNRPTHRFFVRMASVGVTLALFLTAATVPVLSAAKISRTSYYDFGPYYYPNQVLGFTFSSLEQLPPLSVPQEASIAAATGVLPGNPIYGLELLAENVQLTLTFNPVQREELRLDFAAERLSEAKTLTDQGQHDLAADAASTYKDTMKTVADNLGTLTQQNVQGATTLAEKVEDTAAAHAVAAQSLVLSSPPSASGTWGSVLNATETAMDAVADATNQPAVPTELSTSIQSLKEQGLITPEESDKLYSLDSRAKVREEIDKLTTSGQFPIAEAAKLDTAVATNFPQVHKQTIDVLQFAELRTYQTLPPPTDEIRTKIDAWQDQPAGIPPPTEIKPYLYSTRAEQLAKGVDLTAFAQDQQAEVAKFYPVSVAQNPTYATPAATVPSPSPAASPSPAPAGAPGEAASPGAAPETPAVAASPVPSPTPPTAEPYLTQHSGALPGDPTYFLKQFGEGFSLAFTFDPERRLELEMRYADERLREASSLAKDEKKVAVYETTLKRYADSMENIADGVKHFTGSQEDHKDLASKFEIEAARHNVVIEKGLIPPVADKTEVLTSAVEASQHAMDVCADTLDRPALPPGIASRLQDMKAQGLILDEEVSKLTNAGSREEVRGLIRDLVTLGTFPPADAKKLDEGQALAVPTDYHQLTEVRKIEELQRLRAVQAEFAQTATLRVTNARYEQRVAELANTIDPALIRPEDLTGNQELTKAYQEIVATASARPINGGQFIQAQQVATPSGTSPFANAVLSTCPAGTIFEQSIGCVWEDTGRVINDYDQYKCGSSKEYWSFAARKCVAADPTKGAHEDTHPICPIGYVWRWDAQQGCQTSPGGTPILPSPRPGPIGDLPDDEAQKYCPHGATYKAPNGCVWDDTGKSLYDSLQYQCGRGEYYSFTKRTCVAGDLVKGIEDNDATPTCPDNLFWDWNAGRCTELVAYGGVSGGSGRIIDDPRPSFVPPDSPFYFLKRAVETVQSATAFTAQAREEVRLAQAEERFAEGYYLLKKGDEEGFKDSLAEYTGTMQKVYNSVAQGSGLSDSSKKALGEKLEDHVVEHNLLLDKATIFAPPELTTPITAAASVVLQGVDRAADLKGDPAIPDAIKQKIEALPEGMILADEKAKLLDLDSRVEARVKLAALVQTGALTAVDIRVLDEQVVSAVDRATVDRLTELKRLDELTTLTKTKAEIQERVEKTEGLVKKLDDFQKTFEPGQDVPADVRAYVRLTRLDEIAKTVRPDVVRLGDFGNRKDVQLAVATLQEEFKPTRDAIKQIEDFRRNNPGKLLPFDLARVEALSFGLGVRDTATACFLPSPPFAPNTPCPPPGAAIPIADYTTRVKAFADIFGRPSGTQAGVGGPTTDREGKPFAYGQGPTATSAGVCPDGYHWMYDSGGWCMSNTGNYGGGPTPYGPGPDTSRPGYTPYTPYYTPSGVPPYTSGYPGAGPYTGNYYNLGGQYTPPNYYGIAPTTFTTVPPPGTVPGTGPQPIAEGQCPDGFHWMPPAGSQSGWCMANGGTLTPGGPSGGGQLIPPQTCPSGYYWSGFENRCVAAFPIGPVTPGDISPNDGCPFGYDRNSAGTCIPNTYPGSNCGPGYYWNGYACTPTTGPGTGPGTSCPSGWYWLPSENRCALSTPGVVPPGTYCNAPASGCGYNSYWDNSQCSCRPSSTTPPGQYCTYPSGGCGYSGYYDWGSCSCRSYTSIGPCAAPPSGCGTSLYWDTGSCSCRSGTGPTPGNQCQGLSCGGGSYLDYATCGCRPYGIAPSPSTSCSYPSGGCGYNSWYDWGSCSCRSSTTPPPPSSTCNPPSGGCGSGYFDYGSCSCKAASSQGCYNVSATSCGSGFYWDSGSCTCRQSGTTPPPSTTPPPPSTTPPPSGGGSCPSGYHWMSDSGGWCMSDAGGGTTPPPSSYTPPPPPSSYTPPSSYQPPPPPSSYTPPSSYSPPSTYEPPPPPSSYQPAPTP